MTPILYLILLTLLPTLELRASIPYGILAGLNWVFVFFAAVLTNILLGIIIYFLLDKLVHVFLRVRWIKRCYSRIVLRTQKRARKHVERWGDLGLAVFIGIPLPGSGVWTGALAAYVLGIRFRKFLAASIIGVMIAGIIVTAVTLTGAEVFSIFIKGRA